MKWDWIEEWDLCQNHVDELWHYGTPRHSGRYPWGSGESPYQRACGFVGTYRQLRKAGVGETDIAKQWGMDVRQLRAKVSNANNDIKLYQTEQAIKLREKGWSKTAIAARFGVKEGTVRNWLKSDVHGRAGMTKMVADKLEEEVGKKTWLDVGLGAENHLEVTNTRLKNALDLLQDRGYKVLNLRVDQNGKGKKTTMTVLTKDDMTLKESYALAYKNIDKVQTVGDFKIDETGDFKRAMEKPVSVSSKRLKIVYPEEGGAAKDGVIELRKGVRDLDLGSNAYAQVRIAVDDKYYLKGMAMYAVDDSKMPKGVDILFNTSKPSSKPMSKVLKDLEMDETTNNPFGASIRKQMEYVDDKGKTHLSPINIVNEEGTWDKWSRNLSTQVLSKQPPTVAKKQLDIEYGVQETEFKSIMELTNPVVKQKLLKSFADNCDSAAVHLKAAAFPRQASQVILPLTTIPDTQIYAPRFEHGEKVVLIRYPHGGTFEIPELTVNNKFKDGKRIIGNAIDAVGISPKTAVKLSGADFDGDSVVVIPNRDSSGKPILRTSPSLSALVGFDPKDKYSPPDDWDGDVKHLPYHQMSKKERNVEMGKITNLICDMQIMGASADKNADELARAVKHSMVVIDAYKHHLNYKQSEIDNRIAELKERYQGGATKGASTLISRASSVARPDDRREVRPDPETGERVFRYTGRTYRKAIRDDNGNFIGYENKERLKPNAEESTKMFEAKDARELLSGPNHEGTKIEHVYANYANKMKAMANAARKEMLAIKNEKKSSAAAKIYEREVSELTAQLNTALKKRPIERQCLLFVNKHLKQDIEEDPSLKDDDERYKKRRSQLMNEARARAGIARTEIHITPRQWEAIEAHAFSSNTLRQILNYADDKVVRNYCTPKARTASKMSVAVESKVRQLDRQGYSVHEIANKLGISEGSVTAAIKPDDT